MVYGLYAENNELIMLMLIELIIISKKLKFTNRSETKKMVRKKLLELIIYYSSVTKYLIYFFTFSL